MIMDMFYEVPSIKELIDFELASRSGSFIWVYEGVVLVYWAYDLSYAVSV